MKHIWVVESSGGHKWSPAGVSPYAYFTKKQAERDAATEKEFSPGLKWRAAKYVRSEK